MQQKSLGLIETQGLAAGIEAADAAVKSANVELVGYELTKGGGWTTIKIQGDVGAVKAAVDAARMAASKVNRVVSTKVIARPSESLAYLIHSADTVGDRKPEPPAPPKGPEPPVPPKGPEPPTPPEEPVEQTQESAPLPAPEEIPPMAQEQQSPEKTQEAKAPAQTPEAPPAAKAPEPPKVLEKKPPSKPPQKLSARDRRSGPAGGNKNH